VTESASTLTGRHFAGPVATRVLSQALVAAALVSSDLENEDEAISIQWKVNGPIGGILVADYYLLGKGGNPNRASTKSWNPVALGVYVLSFLVGWTTSGHPFKIDVFPFSIFAFNGILSAVLFYWAGMKIFYGHRQTGR